MSARYQAEPIATGFNSPEGPAFAADGTLYFVNWLTSSINHLLPSGEVQEFVNTGGIPAGLAFHPDGSLYCADEGEKIHGVLKITPSGEIRVFVNSYQGQPLNGANDLVFDQNGVLYFSDPWGSSLDKPIGGFYRTFPDGRLDQLATGLAFPNGVAVDPDGSAVYLAETPKKHVLRFAIRADGSLDQPVAFAHLEPPGGPDGMAFDAEGNLYVAHYGGARVDIFDRQGRQVDQVPVPGTRVTNVAFGGPNYDDLVITDVETASVYRVHWGVKGLKLYGGL